MSSDEIVVDVHNLGKRYELYNTPRDRLKQLVLPHVHQAAHRVGATLGIAQPYSPPCYFREFWALRDVSFQVRRGDSFGIIGRNGSGKSTLLQILAGTLAQTSGEACVNGRVAALLELGSGFNPEFSGRENVFLNGLLLGLSRGEVENRFDEIAAFADIGNVLDQPVKTYSSGMLVRLAFAVQVTLEPDILIVDEALSVGDYFFQQKCFGHLRTMRERGLTLLFVSHDMGTVRDLCKQAIYLRKGVPLFVGDSRSAIQRYFNEDAESPKAPSGVFPAVADQGCQEGVSLTCFSELADNAMWSRAPTDRDRLFAVHIANENGQSVDHARLGETVRILVHYRSTRDDENTTVTLAIKNRYDQIVFSTSAWRLGIENCFRHDAAYAVFSFQIGLMLEAGLYSLRVGIGHTPTAGRRLELDTTDWFGPFRVDWNYEAEEAPFLGMFGLPASGKMVFEESRAAGNK